MAMTSANLHRILQRPPAPAPMTGNRPAVVYRPDPYWTRPAPLPYLMTRPFMTLAVVCAVVIPIIAVLAAVTR